MGAGTAAMHLLRPQEREGFTVLGSRVFRLQGYWLYLLIEG